MITPADHKCVQMRCDPVCNKHVFYIYTKFELIPLIKYLVSIFIFNKLYKLFTMNLTTFDVWLTVHRNSVWIRKTN